MTPLITRILAASPEVILQAAERLRAGGIAVMPTETVYGLAASAFDAEAVAQIFAAKERPRFDPLIVHVGPMRRAVDAWTAVEHSGVIDRARLSPLAAARAQSLALAFWPGPLTLILPKSARVPDLVTAGLPTVGVRVPAHPVAQALLRAVGAPLAAPSANRFGRISPTRAEHALAELHGRVEWILDGGPCAHGLESTIVHIHADTGALTLLRPGAISARDLARVAGAEVALAATTENAPLAPGQLPSHYAPTKPLCLVDSLECAVKHMDAAGGLEGGRAPREKIGWLAYEGDATAIAREISQATVRQNHERMNPEIEIEVLSPVGDAREAARNLFAALRRLDEGAANALYTDIPARFRGSPITGLEHAILDRLQRAAAPTPLTKNATPATRPAGPAPRAAHAPNGPRAGA